MSYDTTFFLTVPNILYEDIILEAFEVIVGHSNTFRMERSWYDHKTDIKAVSIRHPHIFFYVTGYGEEKDDIWRIYAMNGEIEKVDASIVFPETKLKKPIMITSIVEVTVLGVDIPIEIEHPDSFSEDDKYKLAKDQIKRLL